MDIAAVGGTPIAGHQEPGGLTEDAVRSVLLLPAELQPQQVISLLGLGGPSFALATTETTSTLATEAAALTRPDGRVVCEHLLVAARPLRRMRGLLGRQHLPAGEGLLLRRAGSIHTFFMRFPIDAVFLDRRDIVVAITPDLPPWRVASCRGAKVGARARSR